jgi:Gpi18-like mannosyltransferase
MANPELDATELRVREWPSLDFSFVLSGIWPLLFVGLIFRLVLQTMPDFESDIDLFQFWADHLADGGPWDFYYEDFFSDYAPGYMYVLLLIGKLNQLFNFSDAQYEYILKLPATIADLAGVYLLWRLLERESPTTRFISVGIYLIFPPALLIGPVWGQIDSILSFFLLLSIYYIARNRPVAGAVAYTVGFVVKPQAIAALPFLALWVMRKNPPSWTVADARSLVWSGGCLLGVGGIALSVPLHLAGWSALGFIALGLAAAGGLAAGYVWVTRGREGQGARETPSAGSIPEIPRLWGQITVISLVLLMLLILPFFTYKPWDFVDHLREATEVYEASSFWSYNFWGVVAGTESLPGNFFDHLESGGLPFVNDDLTWFGIDWRYWGIALTVVALSAVSVVLVRAEGDRPDLLALGTALSVLAFYLFMTRMHERYIFPMFLPMLAACALAHSRLLWAMFALLVIIHFLNIYYVYSYYRIFFTQDSPPIDQPLWPALYRWIEDRAFLLSLLMTLSFPVLLAVAYRLGLRQPPKPEAA